MITLISPTTWLGGGMTREGFTGETIIEQILNRDFIGIYLEAAVELP